MPNVLLPIGKPPGATSNPNITWHPRGPSALLGFVSVHGAFRNFAPEAAKSIKGRVLILHGAEDPVAPMDELNAVISQFRAAKVDFEVNLYSGTAYAFTNPQKPSEVRADDEYKVAMTGFLKDLLAH
jgi:dienelactone hydrolase